MRGRRHYRRGGGCRAVRGQPPCSGPACGPSGQPVNKSGAQQDADADANCGTEADTDTNRVPDGRTDTGCLAHIGNRTDALPLALSWPAEPLDGARSLSAPGAWQARRPRRRYLSGRGQSSAGEVLEHVAEVPVWLGNAGAGACALGARAPAVVAL